MKLIQKGAEAELYKTEFMKKPAVLKKRVVKSYRNEKLDETLRVQRTRKEAKLIIQARSAGVRTPLLYQAHPKKGILMMEYFDGPKVKDYLGNRKDEKLCKKIGKNIGLLHKQNIIHGDLTTSNMILLGNEIGFIDFGLGKISPEIEDKAVDLLNLKKTFTSTHFEHYDELWPVILNAYKKNGGNAKIIARIGEIEQRARYL
ncbi:MAG: Kae1-associated serine/threonine protein kinase [Candidatus Diapherotrites archaeon]|nr:Kae1-associated serine/threonine protein kinase [Candidatus Diapherotrites archaeon]